ncbi:MAG TPA: 2OG-Fe(II) oxygenase [Kofleriaceae bacterium]|jgi:SM-20-related protein
MNGLWGDGAFRDPAWFARAGLLVRPGFLDRATCARLRDAAASAPMDKATVFRGARNGVLAEDVRRTLCSFLPPGDQDAILHRLRELAPEAAAHFATGIEDIEGPQLLVYRRGDFFRPHQDTATAPDTPSFIRRRRIAVVVFLNAQAPRPRPGDHCGGALLFYRLAPDDPDTWRVGLRPEEGLLVAFRADVLHEVLPVLDGERYSMVAWLSAGEDSPAPAPDGPAP